MKISSSFLHFEHTPALDLKIKEVSEKMSKFFGNKGTMKWACYVKNNKHFAEVNYFAPCVEYHARACSNNMYVSIDKAFERIEKQAYRKKDRFNKIHRGNIRLMGLAS